MVSDGTPATDPLSPRCLWLQEARLPGVWYSATGQRVRGELSARLWPLLTLAVPLRERQLDTGDDDYGLRRCRLRVLWGAGTEPTRQLCFGDDAPGDLIYARAMSLPAERQAAKTATPLQGGCADLAALSAPTLPLQPGQRILLLERALFVELTQALVSSSELRLLPFAAGQVQRLELSDGTQLQRRAAGWVDGQGVALKAAAVHERLVELGRAELAPLVPSPPVVPPIASPAAAPGEKRLRISTASETIELRLRGEHIQRDGEPPVPLSPGLLRLFTWSARQLRDRRVMAALPSAVTSLATQALPPSSSLPSQRAERQPQGFVLTAPLRDQADGPLLRALLTALGGLSAESELPDESGPLAGPALQLSLGAGTQTQELRISAPQAEGCQVQLLSPARRLVLRPADCQRIWPLLTQPWPSRSLLLLDDARLVSLSVQCGPKTQTLTRRADGLWLGERRLEAEPRRRLWTALHSLTRAESVRYRSRSDTHPATARCRLRLVHASFAPLQAPEVVAPDSAPAEQCLELLSDGWLRRCDGGVEYSPSSAGQATLLSALSITSAGPSPAAADAP